VGTTVLGFVTYRRVSILYIRMCRDRNIDPDREIERLYIYISIYVFRFVGVGVAVLGFVAYRRVGKYCIYI